MINKLPLPSHAEIEKVITQDVQELYTFPAVAAKLMEISKDEDASVEDLSKVAETDPGISIKILQIVNSAAYSLRRKLTSISEAISYLGFWEMHKMCLGISVFEKIIKAGENNYFDRIFFWQHCLSVAVLSRVIAEETGYRKPEEAYMAGLLHDMGKIFFDIYGRINYGDFIKNISKSSGQMIEEERKLLGMGHDDLGAYFCLEWKLPENIILGMNLHHKSYKKLKISDESALLVSIVSLADFISWSQGIGSVDIVRHPILQPEVEENINIDKIDMMQIINSLDNEIRKTAEFYHFKFPSSDQFRENLLRANIRLSKVNTKYSFPEKEDDNRIHELPKLKESIVIPHRSLDPQEIVATTLEAIYQDFNFDRLYIMKVMKERRSLKVNDLLDTTDFNIDLKSFEIFIDHDSGGFIDCLRERIPVIISGRTSGENKALELFQIPEMVIVPFCNNNQVIGVLGMDNIASKKILHQNHLSLVAIIANELGMALENARVFEKTKAMAQKDGLTGLLNRGTVNGCLTKSFKKAVAGQNELSLMMVDVDYFKKFNDQFGHQAGDAVLKLIADALKKLSRPTDYVGRFGGEEFIVILNNTSFSDAITFGNRIRKEIEHLGQLLLKRFPGLPLTVSVGLAGYHPGIKTTDEFLAKADRALYSAKEAGRNRVMAA